jgi:hypothetical protein
MNRCRCVRKQFRSSLHLFVLTSLLVTAGCTIKLVADYDETTDQGVTALQRDLDRFLLELQRNIDSESVEYARHTDFYASILTDVGVLRVRAAARPKNEITVQQFTLLEENIKNLETLHRIGFQDPEELDPLISAFHVSVTAILKLELAKRRGD